MRVLWVDYSLFRKTASAEDTKLGVVRSAVIIFSNLMQVMTTTTTTEIPVFNMKMMKPNLRCATNVSGKTVEVNRTREKKPRIYSGRKSPK